MSLHYLRKILISALSLTGSLMIQINILGNMNPQKAPSQHLHLTREVSIRMTPRI